MKEIKENSRNDQCNIFKLVWDRTLLCSPGWLQTQDTPTQALLVQGLQAWVASYVSKQPVFYCHELYNPG